MSKIIRPALSIVVRCYKDNWRNIFILATKTYASVYLLRFLFNILSDTLIGTEFITKMEFSYKNTYNLFSLQPFESSSVIQLQSGYLESILGFILGLVEFWLTAPLFTSISRTVFLGEKFDPILWKRLTELRCLQVTFLLWFVALLNLLDMLIKPAFVNASSLGSLYSSVYTFLSFYIILRVFYLIPAIAVGNPPSTLGRGWAITRGKVWAIIKLAIVLLPVIFMIALISFILRMAGISLNGTAQIVIYGYLMSGSTSIIVTPLFITGIASFYKLSSKD